MIDAYRGRPAAQQWYSRVLTADPQQNDIHTIPNIESRLSREEFDRLTTDETIARALLLNTEL